MGCDGGTIPRRDELVRMKKKPETKDKDSELIFQWRYCALTQQPLKAPIVTCGLGKLYNKEAVIEALLNKDQLPDFAEHIKGLKSIKELNLTDNPTYKPENTTENGSAPIGTSPYICPVIGLEMSGKFRFVALWSCGCVFSERALKQIDTNVCHKCQKPFEKNDVIILNSSDEDLEVMKARMEARKGKKEKKIKIKKEKSPEQVEESIEIKIAETAQSIEAKNGVKVEKIKTEAKLEKGKSLVKPGGLKIPPKRQGTLHQPEVDTKKMKADYSVAKDPQASDVYKSLFTTHKSEKEQTRAHWITYNPFYN